LKKLVVYNKIKKALDIMLWDACSCYDTPDESDLQLLKGIRVSRKIENLYFLMT
jgi:hypothetical protein